MKHLVYIGNGLWNVYDFFSKDRLQRIERLNFFNSSKVGGLWPVVYIYTA
jgi:hypothetical protein